MPTASSLRFTQRAGIRGIAFECALGAAYYVAFLLMARDPFASVWLAAGGILIRLLLLSGPHRRGVDVTDRAVRYGRSLLPLADVEHVQVVDRRVLRTTRDEQDQEWVPPGPREATILALRSPEGIDYRIGMALDDAAGFADAIEARRTGAPRPIDGAEAGPTPFHGRQGTSPLVVGCILPVTILADVALFANERLVAFTVVFLAVVAWTARRPVRIDADGLHVGRARLSWADVEQVRCAPAGEVLQMPRSYSQQPLWGPPWVLVVLLRDVDGASPARRRTQVLGIPEPIDLPDVHR